MDPQEEEKEKVSHIKDLELLEGLIDKLFHVSSFDEASDLVNAVIKEKSKHIAGFSTNKHK